MAFLLSSLLSPLLSYGQNPDFALLNERATFGPVVLDDDHAYCYWPRAAVVQPAISAVELKTGRHLWTKPARLANPPTFRIEEGWLQYETSDRDQVNFRRSTGPRTFHLVNASTGKELEFPFSPELRSNVDSTWIHNDRCLTHQGLLVRCSDGQIIGKLGPGEHQSIVNDDHFLAVSLQPDETNTRFVKRILRKFNLETMELEREIELPLEVAWSIVAAKGDTAVARTFVSEREPFLVCMDLSTQQERWRVPIPVSIRTSNIQWTDDNRLRLSLATHGFMRPIDVDMSSGQLLPDMNWRDPRLLLSWYQEAGQYPDFLAVNERFVVGRWRFVQLVCLDVNTGDLIWNHGTANHLISRVYSTESRLSDYLVAESKEGFDILHVPTGERKSVLISDLGLEAVPFEPASDEPGEVSDTLQTLLAATPDDWLQRQGVYLSSLIPLLGVIVWYITRR